MKKYLIIIIIAAIAVIGLFLYNKYGGKIITVENPPEIKETAGKYTLEEVSSHFKEEDCWMAIDNKVYDVSQYIAFHPGGKAILSGCGKDATELFKTRPTNLKTPHPEEAFQKLNDYYIGELK